MTPETLQTIPTYVWLALAAWLINNIFSGRAVVFVFKQLVDYKKLTDDVSNLKSSVEKNSKDIQAAHDKIRDLSAWLKTCGISEKKTD